MAKKIGYWTRERDAVLQDGVARNLSAHEIAAIIGCGCTAKRVYRRCNMLRIDLFGRRANNRGLLDERPYWTPLEVREMDAAFCSAMMSAIKKGKERAPIGVSTKPGTDYARMRQAYMLPPTQSVAAQCAALSLY